MEGVTLALPSSSTPAYVSWEEVNVSSDKGRREVHYYLRRRDGASDLSVIGKEKSLRHMSYHFAIKNRSLSFSLASFYKLKSRREVVYWLNSVVSDSSSLEPYCSVDGFCNGKDVKNMDFGALKVFESRKLGRYAKEFLWLGSSWTCRKKRKHYQSFHRNGLIISIHDFVYVLAEDDKRLFAHLEDLYETLEATRWLWYDGFTKLMRSRKRYCQSKDDDVYTHYSGNRESMDASCADVQDFWNSKNGTESFSFIGGSYAFLSANEAKHYSSQHLKVGSQVEVLAQDSGMRGCWFRARIIKNHKDKVKVQYHDIQDAADEANKLEEWILASRIAIPDQVHIRLCGRTTIRPSSQYPKCSASCIGVGSVVDVWWHDGWWEGIVVEKDSEDKFHVYFPGEKQESVFYGGDLRQSQEWLGNQWINIKERHDIVSSILWGRKQDASKSYDCNLVKTTICDGGHCGKDATGCNESPLEPGNDRAKDVGLVPDLSKDDLLSQLKWKSSRKRKRVTATCVQKLNYSRNLFKSTAGSVTCERFLIPASLKVDNDNCKYMGDPLFSSPVVPTLTSLVMTR
ncbi:uncharacterized protein LOC111283189 isoform X3 [Durio zibethinus]|uniref:Uncharacterized protein LOC111283189 isoform X3 n=1 Tax=Durio zibethinus TaxID=66656 RepID=A0A6P5XGF4_DURZI|nr:uncharacterized protein LOC111283189 isoform X3 [Durio zibethinus]